MPIAPLISVKKKSNFELLKSAVQAHFNMANNDFSEAVLGLETIKPLLLFGSFHKLTPFVVSALQKSEISKFNDETEPDKVKYQKRNLLLTHELLNIAKICSKHSIPLIPYKGPFLSQLLYGESGLRMPEDLDFFIQKNDLSRLEEILKKENYKPFYNIPEKLKVRYLQSQYEFNLIRNDGQIQLEFHWNAVRKGFLNEKVLNIWENLTEHDFRGVPISVHSPEMLLTLLALHGTKHTWDRLIWIVDIAALLGKYQAEINWNQYYGWCEKSGIKRLMALSIKLASDIFKAPIPAPFARFIHSDKILWDLAFMIEIRLKSFDTRPLGLKQSLWFFSKIREKRRDAVRYCWQLLATPGVADWLSFPLPRPFYFLYPFMRPLRLFKIYRY